MNSTSNIIATDTAAPIMKAAGSNSAGIITGDDALAKTIRQGVNGGTITLAQSQWFSRPADERFESLEDLLEATTTRRRLSRAYDVDASRLIAAPVTDGSDLSIIADDQPLRFTHWSFGQTSQRVGAPASYLRTLPADLATRCLNEGFSKMADDNRASKLLTICDEESDGMTLQAVTSPSYGRIWDADVVKLAMKMRERTNGALHNPPDWNGKHSGLYASDHDVFVLMIDGGSILEAGGDRDQLHRGVILANSETGAKAFWALTFLLRRCCGNHLIMGAEKVNGLILRHSKNGPARFDEEGWPNLKSWLDASAQPLEEQIKRAKDYLLPEPAAGETLDVPLWKFARQVDPAFTRQEVRDAIKFAKAEEGDCRTLWQFTNGLTAAARAVEFIDERVNAEKRAGKLMELANATKN